ncbi:MAG: translation initiation factor IF-2 [Candidatus Buchananbacteria bacterium RBG_13_39_9]|uniref:Translation initiation factor IF-2 n=1 Tax=Candidatus Buchananbacteria bacterium RBG_13_39_9 TaxID=1797531 RepID=A0A1G1XMV6_9BACT|nr:MAG: translation initiation factor IF-2 [Candidatus Buchananbacteria bacterium RBG_13_39_9]
MNVSELARKIKVTSSELLAVLPELGFDIGKRAIKVDEKVAQKILAVSQQIKEKIEAEKKAKLEELEKLNKPAEIIEVQEIKIPAVITVRDFAGVINRPVNEVIKTLMKNGVLAALNEKIDYDTAQIIADEFGLKILPAEEEFQYISSERVKEVLEKEAKKDLRSRPPVIVVMGHVDHGKTKLLDTIRKTNVIEGEAGGITQHIGAYQVKKKNKLLTFIDTPGHEAFTAMRSRGAKIADLAILVVAANDSVKPQTVEAIKIIQQAKIPFIVAINKIDLPEADLEKVKKDLSSLNLIPEDWGGKTICVPISAKQNMGIDELLETILLVSEMEKDKIVANPNKEAIGTIIESHIDKGEGPVATVLIQNGTLNLGDNLCIDNVYFGKARALKDYTNQDIKQAGPSNPVKIIGLKYPPKVGDIMEVTCELERKHKKAKTHDILKGKSFISKTIKKAAEEEEEGVKKFNIILRADVLGSLEVITESIEKIDSPEVKAEIIGKGLGSINENDVDLAASSDALILGFHVKAAPNVLDLAREKNVEIKYYNVIYKLLDDVKEHLSALLSPEIVKKEVGKAEVLAIFKTEEKTMIIGVKVMQGKITKGLQAEIYHAKKLTGQTEVLEVQIGKEKVSDAVSGQECGLKIKGSLEIKANDIIQFYQEEKIIKKI